MQEMQVAINYFRENKINDSKKIFAKIIKEKYNQDVYFNYAYILGETGEYKKEQKLYEEILKRNPDDLDVLINYAISLNETKNYKKAISITTKALQKNKTNPYAYEIRGIAKLKNLEIKEGIQDYKNWIKHLTIGNVLLQSFLIDCIDLLDIEPIYQTQNDIDESRKKLVEKIKKIKKVIPNLKEDELKHENLGIRIAFKLNLFYLAYQLKEDKEINEFIVKLLQILVSYKNINNKEKKYTNKKKLLCVISTFRYHSKTFIFDQLQNINSDKFQVEYIVLNNKNFSINTKKNEEIIHYDFRAETYNEVINKLKQKEINILLIPDIGMSIETRLISIEKLANTTLTTWLHPVTSGSKNINYYLSGDLMEEQNSDDEYTEKLIRLPGIGLKIDTKYFLKGGNNTKEKNDKFFKVGFLQTPFKYHPLNDEIILKVLLDIPESIIYFIKYENQFDDKLYSRLKSKIIINKIDIKRVKFVERMNIETYTKFLQKLDIAIDTIGWSGGNTTLDCFGCGLPVLTIDGYTLRAKHTAALYKLLNLEKEISLNIEELISKAKLLSKDRITLQKLRLKIINNFRELKTDHYISNFINNLDKIN